MKEKMKVINENYTKKKKEKKKKVTTAVNDNEKTNKQTTTKEQQKTPMMAINVNFRNGLEQSVTMKETMPINDNERNERK